MPNDEVLFTASPSQPTVTPSTYTGPHAFIHALTPKGSHFSSYAIKPENVAFSTQEADEHIVLLLRRHPITNLPWMFLAIVLLFAPFIIYYFFQIGGAINIVNSISAGILPVFAALWYLGVSGFIIMNFFFWYFNVNIVTELRVLDFDFYFLLYHEFSEALLSKVEDVTSIGAGLIGAIFDLGTVRVQTAGTSENLEFDRIPSPQEVVHVITDLVAMNQEN